jgi:ATP adenylyltransferase
MLGAQIRSEGGKAMDYLWSPWRFQYVANVTAGKQPDCFFCDAVAGSRDDETFLVYRGKRMFVILNRYPYTSGHVMVVPQRIEEVFKAEYKPDGINLGMNLGKAAGAGVLGHLHLHLLPRWLGDSNFITVTGETRVLPEDLKTTYDRLKKALASRD